MAIEELVSWYKAEADRLKSRIEEMESGRTRHQSLDASGQWVDTTSQEIEDRKRRLAQLDALITSWSGQSLSTE
jgi:hypothetical protein